MDCTEPKVSVIMGSASDEKVMKGCIDTLQTLGIAYEVKVLSAHRTPEETRSYAIKAGEKGIEVIIAGAGWASHLAGVIASHTTLPVIGVPIDSSPLNGLDALLSIVQMPPGIPVATVSIGAGGATNAAVLAVEILALKYPELRGRLQDYRTKLKSKVLGR
ncbi:MAG: 5-(carboxyamino)imidazole ribonucleotide mutase [Deltaproteobacteria bacterium]|nr:5-(carboxyamino)imidazole ribonucleotide mutase [Deltaproteobacteria bacterium]MBW2083352.1 5-(carboxyamino)imidazole ribonucleotide mutase [Deltaproteobacteria bacterium]HDM10570.1 5-(carboxyamino)imidazole ribonucleotide mutase [Desulfobacteraceae bacterium]